MNDDFIDKLQELSQAAGELYSQGKLEEAVPYALEASDLIREHLGEDSEEYGESLNNVAFLYKSVGSYDKAEPYYRQALEIQRHASGEDTPDFADSLNNLASVYKTMGKYSQAEPLYRQALDIRSKVLGREHPDLAATLNNLAAVYSSMGEYAKAEPLFLQALEIRRKALGESHPRFAVGLNNLANLYETMGKYAKAEPLYRQALEIWKQNSAEDQPQFATGLDNLAGLYECMGQYLQAEPLYKEALDIKRKLLGENHPNFATGLNNLAGLYESLARYSEAEPLYRQALEIWRENLGEDHPQFATGLNNLAHLYSSSGNYSKAEPLYRRALVIRKRVLGEDHPDYAAGLNNLSSLYNAMGNYVDAIPLLRQALDIWQRSLGENHPQFATGLNNLGMLYQLLGMHKEAEHLLLHALDIRRNVPGKDHPDFADALNNLGLLYRSIGNYSEAERTYRQAIEIRRKSLADDHPRIASGLNSLAMLYISMGDFEKAEPLFRQALEMRRKTLGEAHPDFADSINNLAFLCSARGEYEEAQPLYHQALEIRQRALGEEHPDFADSLNNLASNFRSMGDYENAEPLYCRALEIRRKILGEGHPDYAASLNNLGFLYRSMGKYAEAESLHRKSIEILEKALGESHPDFAQSLQNLSVLLTVSGDIVEAFHVLERACRIQDKLIGRIFSFASDSQRTAYLATTRRNFDCFLSLAWQCLSDSQEAHLSAMNLGFRRKGVLSEAQAVQRDAVLGGRYPHLKDKLNELRIIRNQITQRTLAGPGEEGVEEHRRLISDWESRRERIESDLAREIPEMNLEDRLREADCSAAAGYLKNVSATLVEYVRFDSFDFTAVPTRGDKSWKPARYLAFVLAPDKPDEVRMIDLGEAETIDRLTAQFRTAISEKTSNEEDSDQVPPSVISAGELLREAIFDPLSEALGGQRRVIIAPDGDLSRVPFEALPNGHDGFLIDDYRFTYVAVGRDLLRFGRESFSEPSHPLVVADPDFNLGGRVRELGDGPAVERPNFLFPRLSKTHREGEYLAKRFGVMPWLGRSALEKPLKEIRSPSVLHIATHGFFYEDQKIDPNEGTRGIGFTPIGGIARGARFSISNLENPLLRSGLALAGANTWLKGQDPPEEAEDGLLTAEDVTGMDLLDTELVVLSACETGLGDVHIGEGVMGLRRSFMLAGAKTLVMSLWKVSDEKTRELMEDFYDRLLDGASRAEALRQAQLAMKAKHPSPYFWGAFICQGNPSPLETFKKPK